MKFDKMLEFCYLAESNYFMFLMGLGDSLLFCSALTIRTLCLCHPVSILQYLHLVETQVDL